jgi:hypothetical protein
LRPKRGGDLSKAIRVTTNDRKNPRVTLVCKGKVLAPFHAKPKTVNFRVIQRSDGPKTEKITITRGDGGPLDLELLPHKDKSIKTSLKTIEEGEKYELEVTVGPPWPDRQIRDILKLKTGIDKSPETTIRVYGKMEPRVLALPPRLTFPNTTDKMIEQRVRLRWKEPLVAATAAAKKPASPPADAANVASPQGPKAASPAGNKAAPPAGNKAAGNGATADAKAPAPPANTTSPDETALPARRITNATVSNARLDVRVVSEGKNEYVVVQMPAGYTHRTGSCSLTIRTNDPKSPVIRVPVTFRRSGTSRSPLRTTGKVVPPRQNRGHEAKRTTKPGSRKVPAKPPEKPNVAKQ